MNGLTLRERRLVALAILVGLVAASWFAIAQPILNGFAERREARAAARDELGRNARLIADFGAARTRSAALPRIEAVYAIQAPSPAAAAQTARDRLARLVAAGSGTLQATRDQAAPPDLVRLQADLRIPYAGLAGLLRGLESDRPFAVVEALSIAAAEAPIAGAATPLQVRLEVSYGYAPH